MNKFETDPIKINDSKLNDAKSLKTHDCNVMSVRRIKRGWMPLRLTQIVDETIDTKTFFFEDADDGGRAFDYIAGQYLTFRYDSVGPKPIVRSYTMSSAPRENETIAVTVKRVSGGLISNWMCDSLKPGDILRARGPIGKFAYFAEEDEPELVFVAAGSGVTPFLSMMKELAPESGTKGFPRRMTLLVSYRSPSDLICKADHAKLLDFPNVRIQCTYSRVFSSDPADWQGRIDEDSLERLTEGNFLGKTYFTCGPDEMMTRVANYLRRNGVPENRIKLESFASS